MEKICGLSQLFDSALKEQSPKLAPTRWSTLMTRLRISRLPSQIIWFYSLSILGGRLLCASQAEDTASWWCRGILPLGIILVRVYLGGELEVSSALLCVVVCALELRALAKRQPIPWSGLGIENSLKWRVISPCVVSIETSKRRGGTTNDNTYWKAEEMDVREIMPRVWGLDWFRIMVVGGLWCYRC